MKRKPMLLSKVMEVKRNSKKDVIGLIGAHPGAGVTYTGLLLAFYFGEELGYKTAFLECNNHQDMSLMQSAYEWNSEDANTFTFGHITVMKNVTPDRVAEIFSDQFDCYILDFGTDFITNRDEFLRCGTKLIIGGQSEWSRQKLIKFTQYLEQIRGSRTWHFLIPFAGQRLITGMRNDLNRDFYPIPFEADPTILSKDTVKLFEKLFT